LIKAAKALIIEINGSLYNNSCFFKRTVAKAHCTFSFFFNPHTPQKKMKECNLPTIYFPSLYQYQQYEQYQNTRIQKFV